MIFLQMPCASLTDLSVFLIFSHLAHALFCTEGTVKKKIHLYMLNSNQYESVKWDYIYYFILAINCYSEQKITIFTTKQYFNLLTSKPSNVYDFTTVCLDFISKKSNFLISYHMVICNFHIQFAITVSILCNKSALKKWEIKRDQL